MASAGDDFKYVELRKGVNGLDKVVLRELRGSSAEVYLYGGQVTSWKNDRGEQLLFMSNKAVFKPPKAIRGESQYAFLNYQELREEFAKNGLGVTLFLNNMDLQRPGFGALTQTHHLFQRKQLAKLFVDLILKPSDEDGKIWPYRYEFRLRVTLGTGGDLILTSRIRNAGVDRKFSFTFAYHTYFSVSDISEVRIEELETLDYLDNLKARERFTEQGDSITFESEVEKLYLNTPTKITILDHEKKRTIVLRKDGLPDAVVWNPWDKKAKSMTDFGDDEYNWIPERLLNHERSTHGRCALNRPTYTFRLPSSGHGLVFYVPRPFFPSVFHRGFAFSPVATLLTCFISFSAPFLVITFLAGRCVSE